MLPCHGRETGSSPVCSAFFLTGCSADGYTGVFWIHVFGSSNLSTQTIIKCRREEILRKYNGSKVAKFRRLSKRSWAKIRQGKMFWFSECKSLWDVELSVHCPSKADKNDAQKRAFLFSLLALIILLKLPSRPKVRMPDFDSEDNGSSPFLVTKWGVVEKSYFVIHLVRMSS